MPDKFHRSPNYLSSCSDRRTAGLGNPDTILIYMGTNDAGYGVDPARFAADYRRMLQKLKANYPAAEIWCGTPFVEPLHQGRTRQLLSAGNGRRGVPDPL